jgi:L-alanine-DL-glutamate epimerase-like enolase superfamily enzyme
MKIVDIRARTVPISRFVDPSIPSGGLTTTMVAVVTDIVRSGKPIVGFGFSSIGRFGQQGLIEERFAPRLQQAAFADIADESGNNIDPFRAWSVMMKGEKPGGHGERCVAVGTLDMALWDLAAKIADVPLYRHIAAHGPKTLVKTVRVYAGGGYYYPDDDVERLVDEARKVRDLGYTYFKLKIGSAPLAQDLKRIEAVSKVMSDSQNVAVDAMNSYGQQAALETTAAVAPFELWWFEDICDPLDFATLAEVVRSYDGAVAAGEALFSVAEAKLLVTHGGIRKERDILLFDPAHCYGLPGYLQIVKEFEARGWERKSFWPHGGHLFTLHVVQGLGLGGTEVNPLCFQPFGGLADNASIIEGSVCAPDLPGIGFEARTATKRAFVSLLGDG